MGFEVVVARGTSSLKRPGAEIAWVRGPEAGTLVRLSTGTKREFQLLRGEQVRVRALTELRVGIRNTSGRSLYLDGEADGFERTEELRPGQTLNLDGAGNQVLMSVAEAYESPIPRKAKQTGRLPNRR